ncbi:protein translocase subunit SecF [Clostridium sp. YIM B02515]|uniref:Protein-export membrane protein SecF n=1 Tax=Clostridium rhizosphaerae TaxID=2803861 RepID=A0ABS1T794_9CLOT|nr:protein translocase subunit SecF [Clostridium rhizosphaerae]MBL4935141.1 protein translocase subunit SecF [Clostridium rhizosphaerae]
MLKIIEKTWLWFGLSIAVILAGVVGLAVNGLDYGIDFKGGTIVRIDMKKDFNKSDVDAIIKKYDTDALTNKSVPQGKTAPELEIKSNTLTGENIANLFKEIKDKYELKDSDLINQDTVGASIGNELKQKAMLALALATIAMLIYIGIRFEFNFGAAAIIALLHDVLITLGVYALFKVPVDSAFIAAMLTVIGYSINDTIVVFDRIRENQKYMRRNNITELANASITQTMTRSVNTVLTVMITITAVYIFVPSVRNFAFPLIIGIASGCYSSIFIASPIWVMLKKRTKRVRAGSAA